MRTHPSLRSSYQPLYQQISKLFPKEKGENETQKRETIRSPSSDKQWQGGSKPQTAPAFPAVIYGPDVPGDVACSTTKLSCSHLESPPSLALELRESKQLL